MDSGAGERPSIDRHHKHHLSPGNDRGFFMGDYFMTERSLDERRTEQIIDRTLSRYTETLDAKLEPLMEMRRDYYGVNTGNGIRSEVKKNSSFRRKFYGFSSALGVTGLAGVLANWLGWK